MLKTAEQKVFLPALGCAQYQKAGGYTQHIKNAMK